jgi:hypothetical protein
MRRLFVGCGLLCFLVCRSFAQANGSSDTTEETIKALREEVQELKSQVAGLRADQAKMAEALSAQQKKKETETAQPAELPPAQEQPRTGGNPEPSFGFPQGIKIQGFGEVSYKAVANDKTPIPSPPETAFFGFRHGADNSFGVGDLDLFVTSHLTDKSMVLSEIDFSETADQNFNVNVERLLLKHSFNDYLKVSFGRFHTATSYYNSVFHHGDWLQTAVDRPLVVQFSSDGGLLPSQAVGVSVTGKVPSGALGLNYIFEYGTSDTVRPNILSPDEPSIDEGNGNGITAGLFVKPRGAPGLEIGGSFYHDRLSPTLTASGGEVSGGGEASGAIHIAQSIASVHAVYVTPRFEFLNEAFLIRHDVQETGQEFNTAAFYSLISQKYLRKWRNYFRYQYANASTESPLFPDVGLRHGPSAGVRYDYSDYVAFKVQCDRTFRRQLPTVNDVILQLAFRF